MKKEIQHYLKSMQQSLDSGNATEHSYRPALQALVESFRENVAAVNEPKRVACGAPDFIVSCDQADIGYIECKDLGASLDKVEKTEQLQRYFYGLDNLILTNYLEFRYYQGGELHMQVKLSRIPEQNKKFKVFSGSDTLLHQLFDIFFNGKPQTLHTPRELAEKLANVARIIRDAITKALKYDEESATLHALFEAFRKTILHDITQAQFADMYAQTVCYGMFSARVNVAEKDVAQFSRKTASVDLPATNPFLQEVFDYIAGIRLNASIVWAVDLLASILREADMEAILRDFGKARLQEDPVVHFYESFLAAYDPNLRETRGVYYTPEPVVNYIVRGVDAVLRRDFACADGLADNTKISVPDADDPGQEREVHRVQILDPATGTGTFLYEIVQHIYEALAHIRGAWAGERGYVAEHLLPRLHGFELMMAPYAVAHMKLGWLLKSTGYNFPHNERLRVYLSNTLEESEVSAQPLLLIANQIAREANAAGRVKSDAPIMVVLGNPPYSGHSANLGQWSKDLIRNPLPGEGGAPGYFECDGKPLGERNPKWLNDDYVKFIRFGQARIERTGYGILAFVTNHGYLDNPTFRGMRQSLMHTFDEIYLLDLHGNTKKRETTPEGAKDDNVFDIQQGVSIGIFVKREKSGKHDSATVYHADLWGLRQAKYDWLDRNDLDSTPWERLHPQEPFYLFTPQDTALFAEYQEGWKIGDIMPVNSVGIVTARDHLTIKHTPEEVWNTVQDFAQLPSEEAREKYKLGKDARDWKVKFAQEDLLKSGPDKSEIKPVLYRPFDMRYTYYTKNSRGFLCMPRHEVMRHMMLGENIGFYTCRQTVLPYWKHIFATNKITDDCYVSNRTRERGYLFPLYLYPNGEYLMESFDWPEGQDGRRPNMSRPFIVAFSKKLRLEFVTEGHGDLKKSFGPEDVFHYIYAILHCPSYRDRYTQFLKADFPRIPLIGDKRLFRSLVRLGAELTSLHLLEDIPAPKTGFPVSGDNRVEAPRFLIPTGKRAGQVFINDTQYFSPVPKAVWEFQVGGYQICEKWLKDRKGRILAYTDIEQYRKITEALGQTLRLMKAIDARISTWPIV